MSKIKKTALIGVVGASALTAGYYTFVKPNTQTLNTTSIPQNTNQDIKKKENNKTRTASNTPAVQKEAVTYKDGTYTGAVTKTNKGDFQVSVVVQNGKISNVNVLLQPNEEFSQSINKIALPKYVEEAIEAQSSDIALVSGASETFEGFKGSLQDALNKAK
ncbi:FMN-binding protein [Gemella haemolysans]|uniref:FMN-binding protein n=1 Tax=Gemella haemolysans TaxID=1379 RepID=UPI0019587C6B|nr:FMN-binding protein [Gemella haemolysans]VTX54249.1 FMN-binding domain protein [Gemella haemolysans]